MALYFDSRANREHLQSHFNQIIHKTAYKQHQPPFRMVGFIFYVCKETVRIPFFTFLLVSYNRITRMYFLHIELFHITQHMYIGFSLV